MKITRWHCTGFADQPQPRHTHWEVVVYADDGHPFVTTDEVDHRWYDGESGDQVVGPIEFMLDAAAGRVIGEERLN